MLNNLIHNKMENTQQTKVIIGEVKLSYVHLLKPDAIEGSEPKYSVSLIIPKSDKALVSKIKDGIDAATIIGVASKFGGKKPLALKTPLRDGDLERPDDDAYADSFFINANSKRPPEVVKSQIVMGKRQLVPINDEQEIYSGCYGYASVNFFAYDSKGNRGIAAGLNNVLKTRDGEFLGGRCSADSDFADITLPDEEDMPEEMMSDPV